MKTLISRHLWFIILLIAHLPFVYLECSMLWASREHYQFFPFAFVLFACFFWQRRSKGVWKFNAVSIAFLVADVLLVGYHFYMGGTWLIFAGFVCLLCSLAFATPDAEAKCSLGYLSPMLLITVRIPLGYDQQMILELQRITTQVASMILNHFSFLHVRMGNHLQFPSKTFFVEEACSGVQSLFTVLFLATVLVAFCRRRLAHALTLMACAALFAGVMNVTRISTIAIAWFSQGMDLTTGWQHDATGYIALAMAAFLVFGADAMLEFCFSPVPEVAGPGVNSAYINPFSRLWNVFFKLSERKTPVEPSDYPARIRLPLLTASVVMATALLVLQIRAWVG